MEIRPMKFCPGRKMCLDPPRISKGHLLLWLASTDSVYHLKAVRTRMRPWTLRTFLFPVDRGFV